MIDKLKEKGTNFIFLMGGEPLLYREFGEIIDYVKGKGMGCHLTTNGTLIPQFIGELRKVDLLMVSLDGDKRGNDLNRGEGSWEKITRGIEIAKENNIPLRINAVMTKNNITDVVWLLEYGREHDAYVGFTIPAQCPSVKSASDIILSDEEIISLHKKLLELQKLGMPITLSAKSLKHVLNYPKSFSELVYKSEKNRKNIYPYECCYGRYIVFIDAEGSIYPCTTLWEYPEVYKPKNIFRDGFDEALKNAQTLPCWICYCAGGVEWNEMSSFSGLVHALKFTSTQV